MNTEDDTSLNRDPNVEMEGPEIVFSTFVCQFLSQMHDNSLSLEKFPKKHEKLLI